VTIKKTTRYRNILLPWLIPCLAAMIWWCVCQFGWVPRYLLPHPLDIIRIGRDYIFGTEEIPFGGRFFSDLISSLQRVGIGFALAAIAGVPLGLVSGRLAAVNRLIATTLNALRAVPGISWLPLAMVWFGIGMKTTVFLIALAAFFPIYLNTAAGARELNPIYYQAGAMMGAGRLRGIFAILLPVVTPRITTGLRLAMGIAWAYLVLGELTGVPDGLGALIMDARMQGRIDVIVLGIILIALIGRLCDLLLLQTIRLCSKSARRSA
jgi:sulfonate transport system permease protein